MDFKALDEYVSKYGFDNETGIADIEIAINVNKIRKDRENGTDIV